MTNTSEPDLAPITAANFSDAVAHGFFTRPGGLSDGLYHGLNCGLGSKDDLETVRSNRAMASKQLGIDPANLTGVYQIHSEHVWIVDRPRAREELVQADAAVTDRPGVAVGVLVADCGPVLLCDPKAGVVAAAHAGWQGAFKGVLENSVAAMEALGATRGNIAAALGPCIRQTSYEVGAEFRDRFLAEEKALDRYFVRSARDGHYKFDLAGFILRRLEETNIGSISDTGDDTYPDPYRFFSYRRATHQGEADYGRMLAAIALPS